MNGALARRRRGLALDDRADAPAEEEEKKIGLAVRQVAAAAETEKARGQCTQRRQQDSARSLFESHTIYVSKGIPLLE